MNAQYFSLCGSVFGFCHVSTVCAFFKLSYLSFCHPASVCNVSMCSSCVSVTLYGYVSGHTYNPLILGYGVSKAVLNNAESLRLTTEQTQWDLSAQDIPFCIELCCTFAPSQIE